MSQDDPGTMVCRTAGLDAWSLESGSDARPASGAAMLPGGGFLNRLSVAPLATGMDGPNAPFPYAPRDGCAVEGRTSRELVFPAVNWSGLRVSRRIYIAADGAARWLDFFVNDGQAEVAFQAILESEAPPEALVLFGCPERSPGGGEWTVITSSGRSPWLVEVSMGDGRRLDSFSFDYSPGRIQRNYGMILRPGECAGLLSIILPAATEAEASSLGGRTARDPSGRSAWLSPREKASIRNFDPQAFASSAPPDILLNIYCTSGGIVPVLVEAWDDVSVVKMELSYWEDWDQVTTHVWYEHPFYESAASGRRLKYHVCWDQANSPRHSGGLWRLEATAWDAEGQSDSFLTPNLNLYSLVACPGSCVSWVISAAFPNIVEDQLIWGIYPVQVESRASQGIYRIQLLADGTQAADWYPGSFPAQHLGTYDWDTLDLDTRTGHSLRAVVFDRNGQQLFTDIDVRIATVSLDLSGHVLFGRVAVLEVEVSNPDDLSISDFTLYRKTGSGNFQALGNIPGSRLINGLLVALDRLPRGETVVYRIEARDADRRPIGRSNELGFD